MWKKNEPFAKNRALFNIIFNILINKSLLKHIWFQHFNHSKETIFRNYIIITSSKVLDVKIHFPSALKLNSQQVIVPEIMGEKYFSWEHGSIPRTLIRMAKDWAHAWCGAPPCPGVSFVLTTFRQASWLRVHTQVVTMYVTSVWSLFVHFLLGKNDLLITIRFFGFSCNSEVLFMCYVFVPRSPIHSLIQFWENLEIYNEIW